MLTDVFVFCFFFSSLPPFNSNGHICYTAVRASDGGGVLRNVDSDAVRRAHLQRRHPRTCNWSLYNPPVTAGGSATKKNPCLIGLHHRQRNCEFAQFYKLGCAPR